MVRFLHSSARSAAASSALSSFFLSFWFFSLSSRMEFSCSIATTSILATQCVP